MIKSGSAYDESGEFKVTPPARPNFCSIYKNKPTASASNSFPLCNSILSYSGAWRSNERKLRRFTEITKELENELVVGENFRRALALRLAIEFGYRFEVQIGGFTPNFISTVVDFVKRLSFKPDKPLRFLNAFRFFLPRAGREYLDIVIADLEEDLAKMRQQKHSRRFIFAVLSWHAVRIVYAYFRDARLTMLLRLLPFLQFFNKI